MEENATIFRIEDCLIPPILPTIKLHKQIQGVKNIHEEYIIKRGTNFCIVIKSKNPK